jgi:hypothetical protein
VPHNAIRYILGATGEGRQTLRIHPGFQLSDIDYVFIEKDEDVRAWLLSNPVLEDPLDLLVYCHRPPSEGRVATPPLRGHNYLPNNAVANWARQGGARHGIQAPRNDARPDPGPAKSGGNQLHKSPLFAPGSSGSSDASEVGEGDDAGFGKSSPIAEAVDSPAFRMPMAIQSPSKMNTVPGSAKRAHGGHTQDDKVRKRGAQSDSENLKDLSIKSRQASKVLDWLKEKEARKCLAQFDNENGDTDAGLFKRVRLR